MLNYHRPQPIWLPHQVEQETVAMLIEKYFFRLPLKQEALLEE